MRLSSSTSPAQESAVGSAAAFEQETLHTKFAIYDVQNKREIELRLAPVTIAFLPCKR